MSYDRFHTKLGTAITFYGIYSIGTGNYIVRLRSCTVLDLYVHYV